MTGHIKYAVVDENGLLIRRGTATNDTLQYVVNNGEVLLLDYPANTNVRWTGSKWLDLPPKPAMDSRFDPVTNSWVDPISDTQKIKNQWAFVRNMRNDKLTECDWVMMPDVAMTNERREEWLAYRQGLRDITNQTDPFNITWPVKPI